MTRLVLDPVTRLNGPLRVELDVAGGAVADAWVAATTFRGIEPALLGRDPRDAWLLAQRVCGACNGVHALASVRAVERALGIAIPGNARLVRNLLAGSQLVTSHVTGFYRRQLPDWADPLGGTGADAVEASALARSIGGASRSSAASLEKVRIRLAALAASGRPGPFAPIAMGASGSRFPPAAELVLAAHALDALDWRRSMTRLHTFFGGKSPHPQTFTVGGMAINPPWGGPAGTTGGEHPRRPQSAAPAVLSDRGLTAIGGLLDEAREFVDQVYLPDVLYLADLHRDAAKVGQGIGNYLAFGEFPEDDGVEPALFLPRGRLMDGDLLAIDSVDQSGVGESAASTHDADDGTLRPAREGRTAPRYQGPPAPVTSLEGSSRYSWAKAPRYFDDPMETGPVARIAVAAASGGDPAVVIGRILANLGLAPDALPSTVGRIVAAAIETKLVVDRLDGWFGELRGRLSSGDIAFADLSDWDPARWPSDVEGWSLGESAGGAVGHWLRIRDRRIAAYQVVDGSTWNLSPRDNRGRRGAVEAALVGLPVRDPAAPIEVLRAVHAFDPCPSCAVQ